MIELHYGNPYLNGQCVFTVRAVDADAGRELCRRRFNLRDGDRCREFAGDAENAAGVVGCAVEILKQLKAKADETPDAGAAKGKAKAPARAVEPYEPFPTHDLPEPLAGFVTEAARAIGCDESFVALPLLAGLASAVGATHRVEVKPDWHEPAVLWTAIIAPSGQRKTPPFYAALKPLHAMQHKAVKDHQAAMEEYKVELAKHKKAMAEFKANGGDGEPPAEPVKPVLRRWLVSDATVEAMADRLEQTPRGLLLARDELSGWLASFNQYKSGGKGSDSSNWLQMHNAGVVTVDRKTGDRPILYVPRAAVSITGTIQPRILQRCLGSEHFENGMAARLLLAMPPARQRVWTDDDISHEARDAVAGLYLKLTALAFGPDGEPVSIPLDPEARRLFVGFVNEHGLEQSRLDHEDLEAAWSKLEGYAARLALVLHLVRWATDARATCNRVDGDSMAAGIALARWFGREARRVYTGIAQNDDEQSHQRLVDLIRDMGGRVSGRDLHRRRHRRYRTVEDAEAALTELTGEHLGRWEYPAPGPKGGRPTKLFVLTEPDDPSEAESSDSGDGTETTDTEPGEGVLSPSGPDMGGQEEVLSPADSGADPESAAARGYGDETLCEEGCSDVDGDETPYGTAADEVSVPSPRNEGEGNE